MPRSLEPYQKKLSSSSFSQFYQPIRSVASEIPVLESRGDRPLKMTFDDQLKTLVFYHLEEHVSARHRAKSGRPNLANLGKSGSGSRNKPIL